MSMPEVQTPAKSADPAAVDPTITANEASADPIRSTGTDTLTPETRPEITNENAGLDSTVGAGATESGGLTAPKGSTVVEGQPISEGILNYRAPGLVKSLFLSKKYFWFSDRPLEQKHLSNYLSSEKPDLAHRNAAHATQTGQGLLYFAKRAEDKDHPAGILNLGEMTDFVKGIADEFSFKINGQKHTFQAPSRAERDSWIVTIETKSQEAKAAHEGIVGSEGYKSQLEKFTKPVGATGATTTKSRSRSRPNKLTDPKTKEPTTVAAAEETAFSGSSSDEAKTKSKSRSQSGKRSSLFGTLRGKKEEHGEKKEIKKEEKAEKREEKAEEKAEKEEIKAEEKEAKTGATTSEPLDAAAIAARVIGSPVEPIGHSEPTAASTDGITNVVPNGETAATGVTSTTAEPAVTSPVDPVTGTSTRETAPKANKRNSIFGNFFNKKDTSSPVSPSTETAPAVPAKDSEAPVTSTAPQIEDPVKVSNGETAATTAGTTTEPLAPATEAIASPTAPDSTKPARRTSFFNTLGSKKERKPDATSDAEGTDGEGKRSSKFGGLFRKPSRAVHNNKNPGTEPAEARTEALQASTEAPAPISKEALATSNDTTIAPESATAGQTQTPVQATA